MATLTRRVEDLEAAREKDEATLDEVLDLSRTTAKDMNELKNWLKPLRNGVGSRISKLDVLVDLAEEGQANRTRKAILHDFLTEYFGWLPEGWRGIGATFAGASAVVGGLSALIWLILGTIGLLQKFHIHVLGL